MALLIAAKQYADHVRKEPYLQKSRAYSEINAGRNQEKHKEGQLYTASPGRRDADPVSP